MIKKTDWMSIRIPEGLREQLKKEAEASHRSLAAYVLHVLESRTQKSSKKS